MKLAFYFAKRYFFSKKSVNAINVIAGISTVGVMVSSASLIAILSFYNGLESFILSMYTSVASEIRIEPTRGKLISSAGYDELVPALDDPRIVVYEPVLQEKVLIQYRDQQFIARLKGVEDTYLSNWQADSVLLNGDFHLQRAGQEYALAGHGVNAALGLSVLDHQVDLSVFSPRKGVINPSNPAEEFNMASITVSGILGGHEEINDLVLVPMSFARSVLGEYDGISAVEVHVSGKKNIERVYKELKTGLGDDFRILSREEQNPTLYKIIRSEKWAIFVLLTFTGFIALLNIIGSLTMLVIDKSKDISVLKGMGADHSLISRIFFLEGMMISLIGCFAGLLAGWALCLSQQYFGWLKFSQAENMMVDTYPVDIRMSDFILVFMTVLSVSLLVSYLSSRLSVRQNERLS